jgi:periplasmic protein CpxP/Spy
MRKILSTALALAVLAVGALTLTAFRGHHGDPAHLDRALTRHLDDLLDDVHATDAQRQQINALKDKLVADGRALRAQHAGARQELLAQWKADRPDAARVHALVDARADGMKRMADQAADALLKAHDILTPEQRAVVTRKLQRHLGG